MIFGGDTALTDSFKSLKSHGPYELAIMPIGAYQPWLCSHCSPEQAVSMANDAGAKYFLPVHFKTFQFGREGTIEPLERLSPLLLLSGWPCGMSGRRFAFPEPASVEAQS